MEIAEFAHYPSEGEVDAWIESIWDAASRIDCRAELLAEQGFSHSLGIRHVRGYQYVRFSPEGLDPFYGYWQPAPSPPAPLVVHLPGYGAEMSLHPDIVALGYNVMHISPLGYSTPTGADEGKKRGGMWPVLPDTIVSDAERGYKTWLLDCVLAVRWALSQGDCLADRVSFFGSSQGGGGSLLSASIFRDRGARCVAADVPFLTNFPLARGRGAYGMARAAVDRSDDKARAWRALGFADTLSHARRLTLPVLLTAGGLDTSCPPDTIESLFERLPGTRSYTYLKDVGHRYTTQFVPLAAAWFRLHA